MSSRQKNIVNDAIIKDISETLHELSYGQILITIHDSRIVQIEKIELTRFDDVWKIESTPLSVKQPELQEFSIIKENERSIAGLQTK